MSSPVSSIPNLGPASEAAFAAAGITTAEEIHAMGPDEAYRRLLDAGTRPHFIGYYVLVMGLQGRPWNDCKGEEKKALRKRFDTLCAGFNRSEGKLRNDLEEALSFLGVVKSVGRAPDPDRTRAAVAHTAAAPCPENKLRRSSSEIDGA